MLNIKLSKFKSQYKKKIIKYYFILLKLMEQEKLKILLIIF